MSYENAQKLANRLHPGGVRVVTTYYGTHYGTSAGTYYGKGASPEESLDACIYQMRAELLRQAKDHETKAATLRALASP